MSRREPQAVLVIQRGPLRDFVTSTAAMRQIRAAHPQARITLLTSQLFQPLAKASPYFDTIEAGGDAHGAGEWMALIGRLRAARFERVYDLTAGGAGAIRAGRSRHSYPDRVPGRGRRAGAHAGRAGDSRSCTADRRGVRGQGSDDGEAS